MMDEPKTPLRPPVTPELTVRDSVAISAALAVGPHDAVKDSVLDPERHIELLVDKRKTAPLVHLLRSDPVRKIAAHYKQADRAALAWQAAYQRWGRVGIVATFIATTVGALYLFPFAPELEKPNIKSLLITLEIAALLVMFVSTQWLSLRKHHQRYMNERASAELNRFKLFKSVFSLPDDRPNQDEADALPILPLKLEYFRRFLFEDQLAYYGSNAVKHLFRARRAKTLRVGSHALYIIATAATIPAVMVILSRAGWFEWDWLTKVTEDEPWIVAFSGVADKYLLGIGVLVSAVHTLTTADTRLELNERNAARYRFASEYLARHKRDRLETVRAAAASGDTHEVQTFIFDISTELTQEHIAWCMIMEIIIDEA